MLLGGKVAADGTYKELEQSADPRIQHFVAGQYDKADDDATYSAPPVRRVNETDILP